MSRIGRMPITVPAGVTVNVAEGNVVTVKGPKGELTKALRPEMILKQEGSTITVERPSDDKLHRSLHGLTRTLLNNMIVGVTDGFSKELEVKLENRETLMAMADDKKFISVVKDNTDDYAEEAICPIICEGDVIGGVILLNTADKEKMGEVELKLIQSAAGFLGRQMEQ